MGDNKELERSYHYCESVIKTNSRSFYLAFSKLPDPKNKAVFALYAFCRQADDAIDNAQTKEEQIQNITAFSNELTLFFSGQTVEGPIWTCLADVCNRYEMDKEAFFLQIKGQEFDIHFEQPKTIADLVDYSYHVASSVGLMMLPIVAKKNHAQLREVAINLGVAMQLTNILRDVGEDYHELNRLYLPKDLMEEYHVTKKMIETKEVTDAFINLWEHLAKKAQSYYADFYQNLSLFDKDSQYQLLVGARLYEQILEEIRNDDYSCLKKKNTVKKRDMAKILLACKKELS